MRYLTLLLVVACAGCVEAPEGARDESAWVTTWCDSRGNTIYRDSAYGNIFVIQGCK